MGYSITWWLVTDDFGNCVVCQEHRSATYWKLLTHV